MTPATKGEEPEKGIMAGSVAVEHERAFAEVRRASAAGLDGPELLRRVAEGLRRAVPFDAYCASTVDPASNLITHGIAEGMGEGRGDEGNAFLDRVYFEEDLHQTFAMLREGRPVKLLSESTGGRLDRSLRYRELLEPLGFAHELGGVFADGSAWGGMDLIRGADVPDFSRREVALLRRVAPHIGAGLKAAALRERTETRARACPKFPAFSTSTAKVGSSPTPRPPSAGWRTSKTCTPPGARARPRSRSRWWPARCGAR